MRLIASPPSPSSGSSNQPPQGDASLVRLRLDFAYDGTDFAGWAPQPGLRTVGGDLSRALTVLLRAAAPVRVVVAGRTDAGVHAQGQVAHVDVSRVALARLPGRATRSPEADLVARLRGILGHDLVVRSVRRAPDGFDARYSALERRYAYRIADPDAARDPLRRRDTLWWRRPLDVGVMNAAAAPLEGLRDFAAFCQRREGATTIRTLIEFTWERHPDGVLVATVRADAFCHSMVRALVGAVVRVGEGRQGPDWPALLQQSGEGTRRAGGSLVVPALGLVLQEVRYPPETQMRQRSAQTRARRLRAENPGEVVSRPSGGRPAAGPAGL